MENIVENEAWSIHWMICFNFLAESSFFVKASERRKQKQQQKQLVSIDSPEENNEICSTPCSVTSM